MSERLKNKVCIITGGARGIGAATASLFAREGASVTIGDLKDDLGGKLAEHIRQAGGNAIYVHADVTQAADARQLSDRTVEAFGRIDVLFNNAGTAIQGKVDVLSEETGTPHSR
jgi:NAD(P)-dependent dehydrogenase (short-subunit alcohol dehydrogenase family)